MNSKETLKRVLSYIDKYKYFLVLSMLFAQSDKWIAILSRINSDTITLWTFTLLLLDISFTETFALCTYTCR